MKWPVPYSLSIALHALALLCLAGLTLQREPKPEEKKYLEISLAPPPEPLPPPEPPPDTPPPELPNLAPNTESAPSPAPGAPDPSPIVDATPPSAPPETSAPDPDIQEAMRLLGEIRQGGRGNNGNGTGGTGRGGKGTGPGGHFYEAVYVPEGINWFDAQAYAVKRGGYLVTITSEEENNFVFTLIQDPKFWMDHNGRSPGPNGPWIGGYSNGRYSAGWTWINNEGPFRYSNWLSQREPDNNVPNRRALFFSSPPHREPTWDDTGGAVRLPGFIIEYDREPSAAKGE